MSCLPSVRSPGRAFERCVSSRLRPLGEHDRALIEEGVGHRDRLIKQAARVVAKIDDVALELRTDLLLQVLDRLLQVGGGLFVEAW